MNWDEQSTMRWDEVDMIEAEDKIEQALNYLRHTDPGKTSVYKRNLNRNIIVREMKFLKENFPKSYLVSEDFLIPDV